MASPIDSGFDAEPPILEAFVRAVAKAGDSPTVINRVAANAAYVSLCRRIVSLDPTVEPPARLTEACRKADITASRLRARLNPVARAISLAPAEANASYYQILGVAPDSDAHTIRQAYRRRARDLHPDRRPAQAADHSAFSELAQAYRTLSDPVAKNAYDTRLAHESTWCEPAPRPNRPARPLGARLGMIAGVVLLLVAAALVLDQLDRARSGDNAHRLSSKVVFRSATPPVRPAGGTTSATDLHPERTPAPTGAVARPLEKPVSPDPRLVAALVALPSLPPPLPTGETAAPEKDRPATASEGPAQPAAASPAATSQAASPPPPVNRPRLAIFHAGDHSARLAELLAARLYAKGYPEARIGPASEALNRASNIRFFNAADGEAARRLREDMGDLRADILPDLPPVQLKNLSRRYPRPERGLLEVWLNTGSATNAQAGPEAPPAEPAAATLGSTAGSSAAVEPEKPTEAGIRAFIDDYCRTYEARDPDRLAALFAPTATENGRPFKDVLPRYRDTMARMEDLSYRIELARWKTGSESPALAVEGRFTAEARMADQKHYHSQGIIALDIIPHGASFRIVRLDYRVGKE